jgi:hypothetical protein
VKEADLLKSLDQNMQEVRQSHKAHDPDDHEGGGDDAPPCNSKKHVVLWQDPQEVELIESFENRSCTDSDHSLNSPPGDGHHDDGHHDDDSDHDTRTLDPLAAYVQASRKTKVAAPQVPGRTIQLGTPLASALKASAEAALSAATPRPLDRRRTEDVGRIQLQSTQNTFGSDVAMTERRSRLLLASAAMTLMRTQTDSCLARSARQTSKPQ